MKYKPSKVANCSVVEVNRHFDNRGFFQELYQEKEYRSLPYALPYCETQVWKQINWSSSKKDVLRGIHLSPYEKLITCVKGRIFDVIVDFRHGSSTYMEWFGVCLDAETPTQVFIPANCGHAFLALEDCTVIYCQSEMYNPAKEFAVKWDDRDVGVMWPIVNPILSEKDAAAKTWNEWQNVGNCG